MNDNVVAVIKKSEGFYYVSLKRNGEHIAPLNRGVFDLWQCWTRGGAERKARRELEKYKAQKEWVIR